MRNKKAKVSNPSTFISSCGETIHVIFSPRVDNYGNLELVPTGKESIVEKINSFRAQTDMRFILSRLSAGDTEVLNRGQMIFGDFVGIPNTYSGMINAVSEAKSQFDALPIEIKAKFGNSSDKWFALFGTPEWYKLMGVVKEDISDVKLEVDKVDKVDTVDSGNS